MEKFFWFPPIKIPFCFLSASSTTASLLRLALKNYSRIYDYPSLELADRYELEHILLFEMDLVTTDSLYNIWREYGGSKAEYEMRFTETMTGIDGLYERAWEKEAHGNKFWSDVLLSRWLDTLQKARTTDTAGDGIATINEIHHRSFVVHQKGFVHIPEKWNHSQHTSCPSMYLLNKKKCAVYHGLVRAKREGQVLTVTF